MLTLQCRPSLARPAGDALGDDDITASHYDKLTQLQRLAFKHWPPLRELALSSCGAIDARDALRRHLAALQPEQLRTLVTRQLRLAAEDDPWAQVGFFE